MNNDDQDERTPEESRALRRAFIHKTLDSFRGLDERELRRRMLDPELVKKRLNELDKARARARLHSEEDE